MVVVVAVVDFGVVIVVVDVVIVDVATAVGSDCCW